MRLCCRLGLARLSTGQIWFATWVASHLGMRIHARRLSVSAVAETNSWTWATSSRNPHTWVSGLRMCIRSCSTLEHLAVGRYPGRTINTNKSWTTKRQRSGHGIRRSSGGITPAMSEQRPASGTTTHNEHAPLAGAWYSMPRSGGACTNSCTAFRGAARDNNDLPLQCAKQKQQHVKQLNRQ